MKCGPRQSRGLTEKQMKSNFPWNLFSWNLAQRALALSLAFLLCGVPEVLAQAAQSTQQQSSSAQQQQQQSSHPPQAPPVDTQQQQQPTQKPSQSLDVDPSK